MALVNSIEGADAVKLLLAESNTEAYFGRLKKSLELSSKAIENAQRGIGEVAAQIRAAEGLWAVDYGYRGQARQKAASALTMSSGRRARALTALLLARTGDTTHAQALADELNRRFPSDTLLQRHWLPTIRGSIHLPGETPLGRSMSSDPFTTNSATPGPLSATSTPYMCAERPTSPPVKEKKRLPSFRRFWIIPRSS
jgi:hypothetical protein